MIKGFADKRKTGCKRAYPPLEGVQGEVGKLKPT